MATIVDIINNANILADESIDFDEMVTFFNRAVSKINLETGMLFPIAKKGEGSVSGGNLEKEYYIMRDVEGGKEVRQAIHNIKRELNDTLLSDAKRKRLEEKLEREKEKLFPIERKENQLESANQMFIDMIIIQYIHYSIKVQDAAEYEWRASLEEWAHNMKEFISKWKPLINPDYNSTTLEIDGKKFDDGLGIYKMEGSKYSEVNTWGMQPTSGSGNVGGTTVSSNDPFNLKGDK